MPTLHLVQLQLNQTTFLQGFKEKNNGSSLSEKILNPGERRFGILINI